MHLLHHSPITSAEGCSPYAVSFMSMFYVGGILCKVYSPDTSPCPKVEHSLQRLVNRCFVKGTS